jgi:hypothetical protein
MVPDRLWTHPRITPFAIRLWCCLWFLARDQGETDASDAVIAGELRVTVRTVQRGLSNLEELQFLTRNMVAGNGRVLRLNPLGNGAPIEAFRLKIIA